MIVGHMKVSIVIPVYNVSRYLRRCLGSVGRQTFRGFEVIAVDDGSTDDSGRWLDEYEADFPLRRIHQANRGLSEARNAAMAVASGLQGSVPPKSRACGARPEAAALE